MFIVEQPPHVPKCLQITSGQKRNAVEHRWATTSKESLKALMKGMKAVILQGSPQILSMGFIGSGSAFRG